MNVLTESLFNYKYPNAFEPTDGKYKNLPKEKFLLFQTKSGLFIAIDNTTGDCWTEEFKTKQEAIAWLKK